MKKDKFIIGVKYGVLVRILNRIRGRKEKSRAKDIKKDLEYAGGELLDYLTACTPETLDEFIENVNVWLAMEAKMTGYETTKYTVGQGENIFKKIAIERELYNRTIK